MNINAMRLSLLVSFLTAWPVAIRGDDVDYEQQVKPLLAEHCYACHGALKQESGLRLDTGALGLRGGESGPAIVPHDAASSLVVQRITTTDASVRMPLDAPPLTLEQVSLIRRWIESGAKSPRDESPQQDPREHWAFKRPSRPAVPVVKHAAWVRNPIDAFIAAAHERHGIKPAAEADKDILLRRVYLDLIGLPPTRQELHAFVADESADAYETVVQRLLDSPHYGERWGRHWMDVWRYSDWYGRRAVDDVRNSYPHIWRWRDWIVQSLNEDKGYDRMVMEMLAADEIAPEDDRAIAATGFIVRNWFSLNYDQWMKDLVEHTGKAFLGLRLNCAHCHDHKYDPISQREYFAFRAFFEPLEFRHDRVPGGPELPKYQRYVPGSGASLKPIAAGLPRIFDENLKAETFMYQLGDARERLERPPVEPAAPAFLGGDKLDIEVIDLPAVAWYPGLKAFVREEAIANAKSELERTQATLAKAEQLVAEAAEGAARKTAELTLRVDKANVARAEAELAAIQARIRADDARYRGQPGDADELARAACEAERRAALGRAGVEVFRAERALAAAQSKNVADEKTKAEIKKAEDQLAAAKANYVKSEQALAKPSSDYSAFSPTYPKQSTGRRRALAAWIASDANPLTARVAVNHIWMRHFGRPLVESVFDFGLAGNKPTHPDLLDWLAVEFIESDWSMKHLHALIVSSNTYCQASQRTMKSVDPDNRFLGHFNRRRLEAEAIRDSILHAAGRLDLTLGGPDIDSKNANASRRRSIYFSIYPEEGGVTRFLTMFDPPDPCDCYRRSESVVPQQALAMSNGDLVQEQATILSGKLPAEPDNEQAFIVAAFEQVLSRRPTAAELELCSSFLQRQRALYQRESKEESAPLRARASLVRVLFNHNDFVTVK